MTSLLNPILQRFAEHFPIPTMARAVLERCLNPQQLNAWFEKVAEAQYTRSLLFSTLFELMMQVVSRQQPSIHAAYQAAQEPIAVSVKSVYNKLNGLEPGTSAALVRSSAEQAGELIAEGDAAGAAGRLPGEDSGWELAGRTGASSCRDARPDGCPVARQSAAGVRSGPGSDHRDDA